MTGRSIADILDDWRETERQREQAVTADERIALDRRVAMLTAEYRTASAPPTLGEPTLGDPIGVTSVEPAALQRP